MHVMSSRHSRTIRTAMRELIRVHLPPGDNAGSIPSPLVSAGARITARTRLLTSARGNIGWASTAMRSATCHGDCSPQGARSTDTGWVHRAVRHCGRRRYRTPPGCRTRAPRSASSARSLPTPASPPDLERTHVQSPALPSSMRDCGRVPLGRNRYGLSATTFHRGRHGAIESALNPSPEGAVSCPGGSRIISIHLWEQQFRPIRSGPFRFLRLDNLNLESTFEARVVPRREIAGALGLSALVRFGEPADRRKISFFGAVARLYT